MTDTGRVRISRLRLHSVRAALAARARDLKSAMAARRNRSDLGTGPFVRLPIKFGELRPSKYLI